MKILRYLLIIIALFYFSDTFSQVYTGGAFNINYDNGVCIDVAPEVGYRMKKFNVGIAPFVLYKEITDFDNFTMGGRLYSEYTIYKDIFAHVEIQATKVQSVADAVTGQGILNKWVVSFPIGGGYKYKIAENTYAYGSILYDFFLDKNSPQKNPILRGGVTYDF